MPATITGSDAQWKRLERVPQTGNIAGVWRHSFIYNISSSLLLIFTLLFIHSFLWVHLVNKKEREKNYFCESLWIVHWQVFSTSACWYSFVPHQKPVFELFSLSAFVLVCCLLVSFLALFHPLCIHFFRWCRVL